MKQLFQIFIAAAFVLQIGCATTSKHKYIAPGCDPRRPSNPAPADPPKTMVTPYGGYHSDHSGPTYYYHHGRPFYSPNLSKNDLEVLLVIVAVVLVVVVIAEAIKQAEIDKQIEACNANYAITSRKDAGAPEF